MNIEELINRFAGAVRNDLLVVSEKNVKEYDDARSALFSAFKAVEMERDNYRTLAHGLQDADIVKQAEIERMKSELAEAEADAKAWDRYTADHKYGLR
jgi:hypothetical protein